MSAETPQPAGRPISLFLCESQRLVMRPNQQYWFTVDESCAECRRIAALSTAEPGPLPVGGPPQRSLSDAEIIEIRDEHLPSQGESFDCLAFARAVLSAASQQEAP